MASAETIRDPEAAYTAKHLTHESTILIVPVTEENSRADKCAKGFLTIGAVMKCFALLVFGGLALTLAIQVILGNKLYNELLEKYNLVAGNQATTGIYGRDVADVSSVSYISSVTTDSGTTTSTLSYTASVTVTLPRIDAFMSAGPESSMTSSMATADATASQSSSSDSVCGPQKTVTVILAAPPIDTTTTGSASVSTVATTTTDPAVSTVVSSTATTTTISGTSTTSTVTTTSDPPVSTSSSAATTSVDLPTVSTTSLFTTSTSTAVSAGQTFLTTATVSSSSETTSAGISSAPASSTVSTPASQSTPLSSSTFSTETSAADGVMTTLSTASSIPLPDVANSTDATANATLVTETPSGTAVSSFQPSGGAASPTNMTVVSWTLTVPGTGGPNPTSPTNVPVSEGSKKPGPKGGSDGSGGGITGGYCVVMLSMLAAFLL